MADLGLYVLSSLLGAGYLLNTQKQQRAAKTSVTSEKQPRVGSNIYHSQDYYKGKHEEEARARARTEAAKDPIKSGIIPMYYNTLHIKQDSEKIPNKDYEASLVYDVVKELDDDAKTVVAQNSKTAIHDGDREMKPDWGIVMDRPKLSDEERGAKPDPLKQIGGSLVPGQEDFTHNNMVPFYGTNITQDTRAHNRAHDGVLELYTGQFKLNRPQKKECGLFFKPVAGMTNIYGSHEKRDLSRYKPNNTGKKHNELPFEQKRVGRGLNKGFTDKPSGGFHQTLRIMPKTIEQLRVDPVVETEGRVKAGGSHIGKRTLVAQMYRNRPELLVENKKGERNFTTVGAVRGRKLRPCVVLRDTHRKKSKFLITGAKATEVSKPLIAPKTKVSRRKNFHNTPFRNATGVDQKKVNDYGKSGYKNRVNSRAITGTRTHIIAPKGSTMKGKKRTYDTARKTRKQHYIHHGRPYGNAGVQQPAQGPSYNPKEWAARTTIKQTTQDRDHIGFTAQIGGGALPAYNPQEWAARTTVAQTTQNNDHIGFTAQVGNGALPAFNPQEWTARSTIRQTTQDNKRLGAGGAGGRRKHKATAQDHARTTIRETTENNKHKGWVGQIGAGAIKQYNLAPARTTGRETMEDNKRLGGVSSLRKKHIAINTDPAKTTIRETTERNKHLGGAGPIVKKHIVINQDEARGTIKETTIDHNRLGGAAGPKRRKAAQQDEARVTVRETTEQNDRIGNPSRGLLQSGKGYMTTDWYAPNTNRQFTSDHEYTGVANSHSRKTKSYDDAYAARTNVQKEKVAKGRRPGGGGPRLGRQNINVENKKMDADRENRYGRIKSSTVGNIFNPDAVGFHTVTSERNHLPQHDIRLDTAILDAYKRNPLTHSLSSYY